MSKEKVKKVKNTAEVFSGMSRVNQEAAISFMLGYQCAEERYKNKEMEEKKGINKN